MSAEHDIDQLPDFLKDLRARRPFPVDDDFLQALPERIPAAALSRARSARSRRMLAAWCTVVLGASLWWATSTAGTPDPVALVPSTEALSDAELDMLAHDLGPLAPDEVDAVRWDTLSLALSDEELLAYIEDQGVDPYEVLTYLE